MTPINLRAALPFYLSLISAGLAVFQTVQGGWALLILPI